MKNGQAVLDKRGKPKPTIQGFARKRGGEEIEIFKRILNREGMLDESGQLLTTINPEKAKNVLYDLTSSNNGTPFDSVYKIRGLLKVDPNKYAQEVVKELMSQDISYAELQGFITGWGEKKLLSHFATKDIQVWFLGLLSGKVRLTQKGGKGNLTQVDHKVLKNLGEKRNIGIDFAGAETEEFTDAGMEVWQKIYSAMKEKALNDDGTYVLRTHVGEGAPERDQAGNIKPDSNHEKIANHNVGQMVKTLGSMDEKGQFSDNVVVRLGHVTHADFEQLGTLNEISKKHGVIVEANLTSNFTTGTVKNENEMHRVLLRFLYQENLKVTLNTDGGGVMGTTIANEYKEAQKAIDRFKSGELTLIDEKGKIIYYYDQNSIPDLEDLEDVEQEYQHLPLLESKKNNFNIERLKQESDRYIDEIAPKIGSSGQRRKNINSINKTKNNP